MNYYDLLGVGKDANAEDIKRAYRKLAAKHHPDRGGDTAKFQDIQRAYDTLSDPDKRSAYDNPRPQFEGGFGGGGFHYGAGPSMHDIFDRMFRQHQQAMQIFRTVLWVTLEQVYHGGEENMRVQTPNGVQFIKVQIPRGVLDGTQVRLENVIPNATLMVEFKTQQHSRFNRRGANLHFEHPISILQLVTGTTFKLETISGSILEVTVPPRTQPKKTLKVSGAGVPHMNSSLKGDLFITFDPFMPDNIPQHVIDVIATVA